MRTITSKDGTRIAFEQMGNGPALILVVGAFNDRTTGIPLAETLKQSYTVYNYDRRGRGDSSDTLPYAVEREIEDLDALIAEAGGSAYVFGYSSGAVLAMKAVAKGSAISKLALYEAPLVVEPLEATPKNSSRARLSTSGGLASEISNQRTLLKDDLAGELAVLIAAGKRGEAVELFQTKGVGIPAEVVVGMRNAPFRPMLEKMAHTLVYEMTILGNGALPPDLVAAITIPMLLMVGSQSPSFMHDSAKVIAADSAQGEYHLLEGQNHDIVPAVVAPILEAFLGTQK